MSVSDIIIVVVMYAVGSIPFAYILSLRAGVDLRTSGSRNIGARNAFEVTKRKDIGAAVLVLDFLKGLLPALMLNSYMQEPPILPLALVALVVGHCYPVWLRFHGGRGLATAAGVMLAASWVVLAAWLVVYGLARIVTKDVHVRTVIALCAAVLAAFIIDDEHNMRMVYTLRSYEDFGIISLRMALVLMIGVIFTRHIEPLASKIRSTSK